MNHLLVFVTDRQKTKSKFDWENERIPDGVSDDENELKPGTEMERSNLEVPVGKIAMRMNSSCGN